MRFASISVRGTGSVWLVKETGFSSCLADEPSSAGSGHRHGEKIVVGVQAKNRRTGVSMEMTRSYRDTLAAEISGDPQFRRASLGEALSQMVSGDPDPGKLFFGSMSMRPSVLRPGQAARALAASLMRMLSEEGIHTLGTCLPALPICSIWRERPSRCV